MTGGDAFGEMKDLIARIGGSCACGTITPEPSKHRMDCEYRALSERLLMLEKEVQKAPRDAAPKG